MQREYDLIGVGGVLFEPPAEYGTDLLPVTHLAGATREARDEDSFAGRGIRQQARALEAWRTFVGKPAMRLAFTGKSQGDSSNLYN